MSGFAWAAVIVGVMVAVPLLWLAFLGLASFRFVAELMAAVAGRRPR